MDILWNVPWDHGMGWTVGHTRISEKGQVDIPWNVPQSMGSWDRMDRRIHTHLCEGQVDIWQADSNIINTYVCTSLNVLFSAKRTSLAEKKAVGMGLSE